MNSTGIKTGFSTPITYSVEIPPGKSEGDTFVAQCGSGKHTPFFFLLVRALFFITQIRLTQIY